MDYLGTADYLTSPVSGRVEAWTHYDEWGRITHNAVLKCGQRELDLVKRYATHDFDSVLELYYAKARFYDPLEQRFTAVDPILDPSKHDLREYVRNPVQFVQYLYVQNQPLVYIDSTGEVATTIVYAGTIFVVGSLEVWLSSPSGQQVISSTSKIIADGITYAGKEISNFVSKVILGKIGFVGTVIITTPANVKATLKETLTSATQATAKILTRDVDKTVREYMNRVDCEGKGESNSNSKSGNKKNDQSDSKPNSQGKDQSAANPGDPQKGDGGNGKKPVWSNQNPKDFESQKQSSISPMSTFREKWDNILQKSTKRPKEQQPNSSLHIYDRNASQGESTAVNDFNSLNLENIVERTSSNGTITRIGRDPENNVVNMHYSSKEHIWTVEYKNWKIRYPEPPKP